MKYAPIFAILAALLAVAGLYMSIVPLVIAIVMLIVGLLLMKPIGAGSSGSKKIFIYFYGLFLLLSALSSFSIYFFDDTVLSESDPARFYLLSSDILQGLSFRDVPAYTDAVLPAYVWSRIYGFTLSFFSFGEMIIGVSINSFLMALAMTIAYNIAVIIRPVQESLLKRFLILGSITGGVFLIASTHLRDAFSCFAIALFIYSWIRVVRIHPSQPCFFWCVFTAAMASWILFYTRKEFAYFLVIVPFIHAIASWYCFGFKRSFPVSFAILIGFIVVLTYSGVLNYISILFDRVEAGYYALASGSASADSIGYLIRYENALFRPIFGSIYLVFYPLPIWGELQAGSLYYLYKAINGLVSYWLIPSAVLVGLGLAEEQCRISVYTILFLLGILVAAAVSISLTSGESRHWFSFLPLLIAISSCLNFKSRAVKRFGVLVVAPPVLGSLLLHFFLFARGGAIFN